MLAAAGLAATVVVGGGASAATDPQPAAGVAVGAASIGGGLAVPAVEVFYQAQDHTLVQKSGAATSNLGGVLTSGVAAIAAVTTESLRAAVYARGTDGAVWSRETDDAGVWQPWRTLGGRALGAPGATWLARSTADPIVYVRGLDGAMWRSLPDGGFVSVGGVLASDPAGLAPIAGRQPAIEDVFAIGSDRAVWEWIDAAWRRVGGQSTVAPSVTLLPDGSFDLYVRGLDGALWTANRSARADFFGPFHKVGGVFTSPVTATVDVTTGTRVVHGLGADGDLWKAEEVIGGAESWRMTEVQ
jgi:hypothetical protein